MSNGKIKKVETMDLIIFRGVVNNRLQSVEIKKSLFETNDIESMRLLRSLYNAATFELTEQIQTIIEMRN